MTAPSSKARYRGFYEREFRVGRYASGGKEEHADMVRSFATTFGLESGRILEVGCGHGLLSKALKRWVGLDHVISAGHDAVGPFMCASADALPFRTASFDAAFSIDVLEHVPALERALLEIGRVVRPGGLLLLRPAWFCRPWAAGGYEVRRWRDLDALGKVKKLSIPLRNARWFRAPSVLLARLKREVFSQQGMRGVEFETLQPNYDVLWQADSDACNSIDPHAVAVWFRARGWHAVGYDRLSRRLVMRHSALILRKPEREGAAGGASTGDPAA